MDVKRVVRGSKEYDDLISTALLWWEFWKFPPPSKEFLPVNMICAYNESGPCCIGFLYCTDSKISWLEWIVVNPKSEKADRAQAIEMVLSSAKILSSALGFGTIFTTSKHQNLNKKLEKKYKQTDVGVTHYIGMV